MEASSIPIPLSSIIKVTLLYAYSKPSGKALVIDARDEPPFL
jgi:hypothetical protein